MRPTHRMTAHEIQRWQEALTFFGADLANEVYIPELRKQLFGSIYRRSLLDILITQYQILRYGH